MRLTMNENAPQMTDEPRWTVEDVARYFRKSQRWVRGEYLADRLPVIRIGNSIRFDPEVIRAIGRGEPPPRPPQGILSLSRR
jgi:hypothetical protein